MADTVNHLLAVDAGERPVVYAFGDVEPFGFVPAVLQWCLVGHGIHLAVHGFGLGPVFQ